MIDVKAIRSAADRIRPAAVRTPLIDCCPLSDRIGRRVLLKLELVQRGGSFKFRGAYNRLVQLDADARRRGVVAWSSGNHAQGIAWAGKLLDVAVAVVMPADAPAVKVAQTRALGAEVIAYDRYTESREDIARRLTAERGATLVPSYDDPDIIAGQGTVGLEIAEQAEALGVAVAECLIPVGGGGLIAGSATALAALSPGTRCWAVEPAAFDDTLRSLQAGAHRANAADARSICDALLAPTPGEITFAINRHLLAGGLTVDDDAVRAAVRYGVDTLKLVAEPGGAVALAAILQDKAPPGDGAIVAVVSGGNIDGRLLADIMAADAMR